jgi:hypothetical protein
VSVTITLVRPYRPRRTGLSRGGVNRDSSGSSTSIAVIEQEPPATVYNLTVDRDHTYFVGAIDGGVWVHNANCRYSAGSRGHVFGHGHSANSPRIPGKSRFYPTEGGQKFTDEVTNHPNVTTTTQGNRTVYSVNDLGRGPVGTNQAGAPTVGGRVVVEGPSPAPWSSFGPDEVVTQFPL